MFINLHGSLLLIYIFINFWTYCFNKVPLSHFCVPRSLTTVKDPHPTCFKPPNAMMTLNHAPVALSIGVETRVGGTNFVRCPKGLFRSQNFVTCANSESRFTRPGERRGCETHPKSSNSGTLRSKKTVWGGCLFV